MNREREKTEISWSLFFARKEYSIAIIDIVVGLKRFISWKSSIVSPRSKYHLSLFCVLLFFFSLRLSLIYWNLFLHHTHSSKVWEIHSSPFRLYWETVWHLFVGHNNKISPVQYKHWFALIVCGYCVCICRKLKSDCRINECRCPFSVCLFEHIVIVHFTIDTCYVYQYILYRRNTVEIIYSIDSFWYDNGTVSWRWSFRHQYQFSVDTICVG